LFVFGDLITVDAVSFLITEYPVKPYSGLTVAIFSSLNASKAM